MDTVLHYWPLILALAAVAVQWGIAETRIRGAQHQINSLRSQLDAHLSNAVSVHETLARLDERTAGMADRMERIETRLNGQ